MFQSATLPRLMALVLFGMSASGCAVIGDIFKAGVWVGALAVIGTILLVVLAIAKMKG